jgi:DNA polymerase-3 subunit epsilon
LTSRTLSQAVWDIREVGYSLEQMARSLVESGDYRVTNRLEPQAEYHPPDNSPKLVAAVVDVETTGTNPDRDKIVELGICLFEYDRQSGRIYKVLGSWEWLEDPGGPIPPEITTITGITDAMVAGHRIEDCAVNDLLDRVVLVIAHNADFDRRFLEKRLPAFATKHWACSRSDIDWKAEGIRSSALEFIAYSLGFFHDGHRAASDCQATLHALAQPLPGTGRLAFQALLEQARLPTWRLWAREAAIEKKDVLKARGYAWSPGEFGRPKCWYRDVADADKAAEVSWLRENVYGAGSGRVGIAHDGEESIFRSMLVLGRTRTATNNRAEFALAEDIYRRSKPLTPSRNASAFSSARSGSMLITLAMRGHRLRSSSRIDFASCLLSKSFCRV